MSFTFNEFLSSLRQDQAERHGRDYDDMTQEELAGLLHVYSTALFTEVAELVEEFDWKPWKQSTHYGMAFDPNTVAAEAADVLHFLGHLCNMAGLDDDMLSDAFDEAREKNRRRLRDGYRYDR